jgi:hypothetical protein
MTNTTSADDFAGRSGWQSGSNNLQSNHLP